MDSFDFMPDKEFYPIFNRISSKINLHGAGTPEEINERFRNRIKHYKEQQKVEKLPRLKKSISQMRNLIRSGFSRRTIDEAVSRPRGIVGLTLKYGRDDAKKILLARARDRIGRSRRIHRR